MPRTATVVQQLVRPRTRPQARYELRMPNLTQVQQDRSPIDATLIPAVRNYFDYSVDVCQRIVLSWDALHQRADNMREHERADLPPLLHFKYETILDARRFRRPVNYALLRIIEIGENCTGACVDSDKALVIVIDPRAEIGGSKCEFEVSLAPHEGHAVCFVMFFPESVHRQTPHNVQGALRRFVEQFARRHNVHPPILYGNCKASWTSVPPAARANLPSLEDIMRKRGARSLALASD